MIGTIFAKLGPILFGMVILSKYGTEPYSLFISFILIVNMAVNLGVMGVCPQILSNKDKMIKGEYIYLSIMIVSISAITTLYFNERALIGLSVPIIVYAISFSMIYLCSALLNMSLMNTKSALLWASLGISNVAVIVVLIIFNLPQEYIIYIYTLSAVMSSVFAFILVFFNVKVCWRVDSSIKEMLILLKRSLYISLFGFAVISSFFYSQSNLFDDEKLVFSLFYQFFTIVTFLPGVIGNVLIPRISSGYSKIGSIHTPYIAYSSIFLLISFSFFLFYLVNDFFCLSYFDYLIGKNIGLTESIFLWGSSFFAVFNSYSIQLIVSSQRFGVMVIAALIWFITFYGVIYSLGSSIIVVSFSFLFSYASISMYLFFKSRNEKNEKYDLFS